MYGPLARMLKRKAPLILDGAMGTELQRRGVDVDLPLWSANALITSPETVLQIHRDYVEAGADIITTNTFRTTRRTMRQSGLPDRSRQLTAAAVELAHDARDAFPDREVLIAGCIAPLEDCYRPDLVPGDAELREEHAELAARLAEDGVDFFLLETMNTAREAYAACAAAAAVGKEVVVSFICNSEGNLYGGDSLVEAITSVSVFQPAAFSVNCISPKYMKPALDHLTSATHRPFAVYGNVGTPGDEQRGDEFTREVLEEEYATYARDWYRRGASIIGGCCGTTPEYIRILRKSLPIRQQQSK